MVLSGDLGDFSSIAAVIEAYAFRGEDSEAAPAIGGEHTSSAKRSFPLKGDEDDDGEDEGGGHGGMVGAVATAAGGDMPRRRLAALDNCLDAFDRSAWSRLSFRRWIRARVRSVVLKGENKSLTLPPPPQPPSPTFAARSSRPVVFVVVSCPHLAES